MNDLLAKLRLMDSRDDCNCNVASFSPNPMEHDEYCAFRLGREAAADIVQMRGLIQELFLLTEPPSDADKFMMLASALAEADWWKRAKAAVE